MKSGFRAMLDYERDDKQNVKLELTETEFTILKVLIERAAKLPYMGNLSEANEAIKEICIELNNKMELIEEDILIKEKKWKHTI